MRLFCFPYAGGGASAFRSWAGRLSPAVAVHPVQLPGRETRIAEQCHGSVESLVDALATHVAPHLDAPYAFFGHSMGALLSFELARAIRRRGHVMPAHLFVSGRRAPHLPRRDAPICHLADGEFLLSVRRLNGIPEELLANPELLELVMPSLRADVGLCERYVHRSEPSLSASISVFGGEDDPHVTGADLHAWSEMTTGPCRVSVVPGGHFFIYEHDEAFFAALNRELAMLLRTLAV